MSSDAKNAENDVLKQKKVIFSVFLFQICFSSLHTPTHYFSTYYTSNLLQLEKRISSWD